MTEDTSFLNAYLIDKIQSGDCVLFLGAGATFGSVGDKGQQPVTGAQLRDLLSDKYLCGKHKDKSLPRVAEFAKYESSLADVQSYIRDLFSPLKPAAFHKLIPLFRWHAIVTTNYDLIVERAYDQVESRQQQLRPIIRDGDNFSEVLKDNTTVPYLKLHGCINTINDENLPLILGSEEYAKHQNNRKRLFSHFSDWARERPVVFVGYDISDPNIQQILFDLTDLKVRRPTYAIVDPALDEIAKRYWSAHKFIPEATTFEDFIGKLNSAIPTNNRVLASLRSSGSLPISSWLSTSAAPSQAVVRYVQEELFVVSPAIATEGVEPRDFYSGKSLNWGAFEQQLDFKRRMSDDLILDIVLSNKEKENPTIALVKGHAGSGKTVLLRRFAWDAAKDFDARVILLKEGSVVRPTAILEIAELTKEPIVFVVDDCIKHTKDISYLYKEALRRRLPLRIVIGARSNEWNLAGLEAETAITDEYELSSLSEREIDSLLNKLSEHNALGELAKLPRPSQVEHFRLHAEYQLMVALHEATTGKKFEDLAFDEYEHIQPPEARILYLDICTLHRLGVPVRAGLVSRVSDITFEYFSRDLFRPLEHVVKSYFDSGSRDYVYRSRHPLIAEFVFRQALPDPIERAAQLTRIIRHMDTDYESDSIAFDQLIRGRTLAELFADKMLVRQIFDAALESGAPQSYVLHQIAVFELHHPNGSMKTAMSSIDEAHDLSFGRDRSIEHTKATVLRRLALEATHPIEVEKYRADAKQILKKLQSSAKTPHAFSSFGRLLLDELKGRAEAVEKPEHRPTELASRSISDSIRQIEESISTGLQRFPGDEHLLTLDSDLAKILKDHPRTLQSLEEASAANPGRPFIAIRLAATYKSIGRKEDALKVLHACLQANPANKECHLAIARLLMADGEFDNRNDIQYHLKRAYTDGDANFEAQYWYARHELIYGDRESGQHMFKRLAEARMPPLYKNKIQGSMLDREGHPITYTGYVKAGGPGYCFISCAELRFDVYSRSEHFSTADWEKLRDGSKVSFRVSFNMRGPVGTRCLIVY